MATQEQPTQEQLVDVIIALLHENERAIHPSRGKQNAQLVRWACDTVGLQEDDFLARHIKRDKKGWGLDER